MFYVIRGFHDSHLAPCEDYVAEGRNRPGFWVLKDRASPSTLIPVGAPESESQGRTPSAKLLDKVGVPIVLPGVADPAERRVTGMDEFLDEVRLHEDNHTGCCLRGLQKMFGLRLHIARWSA